MTDYEKKGWFKVALPDGWEVDESEDPLSFYHPEGAGALYEIVIDGLDLASVEEATRVGVRAACRPGVLRITAGNYGGKLGPFHLHLHKLLAG